jgi:hypothetical protein
MSEEKNKPVSKYKAGNVECAVWEQKTDKGDFLTVSSHRNYLKKDGDAKKSEDWEKTNSLRINDIPAMILVLQKAYEYAKLGEKKE